MDNIERAPIIVVACTNCLQSLDSALRRRFGRVIEVGIPDEKERLEILLRLMRIQKPNSTLRLVAGRTQGFTGAELADLYSEAQLAQFEELDLEKRIKNGHIQSGRELTKYMRTLRMSHWESSGRLA